MATIKEIAKKAGVSPTTVSNVLHGRTSKVSAEKVALIQTVLEAENYTPNMGAILLAHQISRIIGVIVFMPPRSDESVFQDPFTATIIGALEKEIQRNGYFMMLYTTEKPERIFSLIENWKLDGLIIFWVDANMCSHIRKHTDIPIVFIDCYFHEDGQTYHNVGLNDFEGSYTMTRHLLAMGHRRIAFLADRASPIGSDRQRLLGFRQALAEEGIPEQAFLPLSKDTERRCRVYQELCSKTASFTALFFSADYYAVEALRFFQTHGISIPEQFSIAGFDDNKYAKIVNPPLTTIHQDTALRGTIAAELLIRLIQKKPVSENIISLPVHLVIRESVKRL